jgi:hypothetical protein
VEHLLVVAVAALAGYVAYRASLSLGRRLGRDEALPLPPPAERGADAGGLAEDRGRHPLPRPPGGPPPGTGSHRRRRRGGARDPEPDGFAYGARPLAPLRIPARTRLLGILGLVALIVLAAVLIAVALYQVGHLVRLQFESYLR